MRHKTLSTLLLIVICLMVAVSVQAHTDLIASEPAPGATLEAPPEYIRLTFSDAVTDGEIRLLFEDELIELRMVEADEPGQVQGQLETDLAEGSYQVLWTAISADGDEISGSYGFVYSPASDTLPYLILAGIFVAMVAVGIVLRGRYFRQHAPSRSNV